MNPGELNQQIDILSLSSTGNIFSWAKTATTWAKVEEQDKTNIFSKIGIGVKTVKFTIRKRELTLYNAIRWRGRHHFLTGITAIDRMYYEITAAQIEPVVCTAIRNIKTLNELKRPVFTSQPVATFPASLVEKYMGYRQEKPQAVNDLTYVLVTPKAIQLQTADLVKIGDDTFNVQNAHTLDEYKNEYEIALVKDV